MNTTTDASSVPSLPACIVCRSKHQDSASQCLASLSSCAAPTIFETLCESLCETHRQVVVRALVSAVRPSLPPLSIANVPQGDRHVVIETLKLYEFLEVVELFVRIAQVNSLLEGSKLEPKAVVALRGHTLARMAQESRNPLWQKSFIEHMASELRNVHAARQNLAWRCPVPVMAQVQDLWEAIWPVN